MTRSAPGPRVVSLVPSTTATLAALGAASRLVGVTDWCVHGAPASAARVGGTKNPSIDHVVALQPDVVLANREENRREDVEALRTAGLRVEVGEPRSVDDVLGGLDALAELAGADPRAAHRLARGIDAARAAAHARRPDPPVRALVLVWRRPWMAVGADTYAAALLADCGFAPVVDAARYPRVRRRGEGPADGTALTHVPEVVLLPSEPYTFAEADVPAVRDELVGPGVRCEAVDGELLTWHGAHTAPALEAFSRLAARLAAAR